jgi:transcriptional regulator PpsR
MRPFARPQALFGALDAQGAARALALAADLTLLVDADGVVVDLALDGAAAPVAAEQWVGRRWLELVSAESRAKVEEMRQDAGAAPRWRQLNFDAVQPEWTAQCIAVRLPAGAMDLVFARDLGSVGLLQQRLVEAQQAMERDYWRLRHVETRYRLLFQVAQEGVLVVDATSRRVLEANPAAQQLLGGAAGLAGQVLVGALFPLGFDTLSEERVDNLLAGVRATGRADQVRAELAGAAGEVEVAASAYRQGAATHYLVRVTRVAAGAHASAEPAQAMLLRLAETGPDCLVVTDLDGRVLSANDAFVELAQLGAEEQARGHALDRWLGRSGVDLGVLISNLRQRGAVRLFATTLRGEYGALTEVEISANVVPHGQTSLLGFTIRDVGRRLRSDGPGGAASQDMARAVGRLTELVGRMPLKEIVGETTDLIERLCIEAALELTRDNRASAAEMLGLSRQSLYVKLRRHGLGDLGGSASQDG